MTTNTGQSCGIGRRLCSLARASIINSPCAGAWPYFGRAYEWGGCEPNCVRPGLSQAPRGAAVAVLRQRLRGAHIRSRLVPVAGIGDWLVCGITGNIVGCFHGGINPALSRSPWFDFQLDALRCAWAVLPAACLWGASFPLALAAAAPRCDDPARLVGRVYAANTVGAVLGALACSIFLVGWLGTQRVQQILIGLSAASGLLMFWPRLTSLGGKWVRSAWQV